MPSPPNTMIAEPLPSCTTVRMVHVMTPGFTTPTKMYAACALVGCSN